MRRRFGSVCGWRGSGGSGSGGSGDLLQASGAARLATPCCSAHLAHPCQRGCRRRVLEGEGALSAASQGCRRPPVVSAALRRHPAAALEVWHGGQARSLSQLRAGCRGLSAPQDAAFAAVLPTATHRERKEMRVEANGGHSGHRAVTAVGGAACGPALMSLWSNGGRGMRCSLGRCGAPQTAGWQQHDAHCSSGGAQRSLGWRGAHQPAPSQHHAVCSGSCSSRRSLGWRGASRQQQRRSAHFTLAGHKPSFK